MLVRAVLTFCFFGLRALPGRWSNLFVIFGTPSPFDQRRFASISHNMRKRGLLALLLLGCGVSPADGARDEVVGDDVGSANEALSTLAFTVVTGAKSSASRGFTLVTSKSEYYRLFGATPPASIDFQKHWLVHYSAGAQFVAGHAVSITKVARDGKKIRISVLESQPSANCATVDPFYPQATVRIAKQIGVTQRETERKVQSIACASTCSPVYVDQNNGTDASRFNIVFVGVGFSSVDDVRASAARVVDLDGASKASTGAYGMMQIPSYASAKSKLNFWYVSHTAPFSNTSGATVWNELYRTDWLNECQTQLPNRVIPVFIYPRVANDGTSYPYASMGRRWVTLADCFASGSTCSDWEKWTYQQSNVHEMQHTLPCLWDEYGAAGNANASTAVNWSGTLTGNATSQFWAGSSYASCVNSSPWKSQIGNGCGKDGVIDCFKPECTQPISFVNGIDFNENCCLPGKDCLAEIGCFEGGAGADKGIWRATAGTLMRSPYYSNFTRGNSINSYDQSLITQALSKGPAVGKTWSVAGADATAGYALDCDTTRAGFEP